MKKISLGGIALALLIGAFYAFVLCMTSVIPTGGLEVAEGLPAETETPSVLVESEGGVPFVSEPPAEYSQPLSQTQWLAEDTPAVHDETAPITQTVPAVSPIPEISSETPQTISSTQRVTDAPIPTSKTTASPVTTPKVTTAPTTAAPVTTPVPVTTPAATTPMITTPAITTPMVTTPAVTTRNLLETETGPSNQPDPSVPTIPPITTPDITPSLPSSGGYGNETLTYTQGGIRYTANAYDVVCQIVNAEMGITFHEEALKAQAVAAYSYMKYSNQRGVAPSVALKGNVSEKVKNAVSAVAGQAVYYNGSLAQTVYSASSGGYTASAGDVWGNPVPYLVSVESIYDQNNRYYGCTVTFTEEEVRSMLESKTGFILSSQPENWIVITGSADGGYVGSLLIDGHSSYMKSGRTVPFNGRVLREDLFSYKLKSAKFTVFYANGIFTFTSYGYGHGVGMSQLGANGYANAGWNYLQILTHYYSGTTVC